LTQAEAQFREAKVNERKNIISKGLFLNQIGINRL
jgi:hypothetical protein